MSALVTIREDVHVHAPLPLVRQRILDLATYDQWLVAPFRDFRADDEGFAFTLTLPGRTEHARLRRGGVEDRAVTLVRDGDGSYDSITWAMHAESTREVHVTVEVTYAAAGGILGGLMETTVHRPHRTQALRDALWQFKQLLEREAHDGSGTHV